MKAFPQSRNDDVPKGMDLRDYFAAKALQGLLIIVPYLKNDHRENSMLADQSYEIADEMMRARDDSP